LADLPFLRLGPSYQEIAAEIDEAVGRVLASGWYIAGPEVDHFERAFGDYCGTEHCVGVGNGLDALHLALRALDVRPGDEVILASNSFIATVLAITITGATPVLVEPDPITFNMDPAKIAAAVTDKTRVILPTHLYGQPADIDAIHDVAREHGLRVIEDAAQAHGARYNTRRIGGHSDVVCWSFYPTKNLGAFGDGGAITTNDAEIAERVRVLGNYGSSTRYISEVKGVNSRLDPLQAAVLNVKLRYLDEWNERRTSIAKFYAREFADLPLSVPVVPQWADPSWHLYIVQSPHRDQLRSRLAAEGVETIVHYPVPPHLQAAYRDLGYSRGTFPIAERLADSVLSLPMSPHLSLEDAARIAAAVRKAA
jgi:dTDP-4-amino-4,6-dideoxygalactose transaminase